MSHFCAFFIIPIILTTTYFKTETSKSLINVMGLALIVFIISWSISLFLERKVNMYEILFEEHSKMVKVMDIILQNREYELKASESGDIWINILDDSKVIDSITVVQTGTLWNIVKIEMEFKHTYNKKYGIICGWRIKTLCCMAIRERKENEITN